MVLPDTCQIMSSSRVSDTRMLQVQTASTRPNTFHPADLLLVASQIADGQEVQQCCSVVSPVASTVTTLTQCACVVDDGKAVGCIGQALQRCNSLLLSIK